MMMMMMMWGFLSSDVGLTLFEERRVRHCRAGALVTLGKHGGGLAVFRELNAALPPPSPVVNGGHPSLPPTPGTDPGRSRGSGG